MSNFYTRLQVICDSSYSEILMAEIAEAGFDTFMETDTGFEAYAEENKADRKHIEEIQQKYAHVKPLLLLFEKVEKQNWNEEWEKNVDPIIVEDTVLVRAAFHQLNRKFPIEIIITPKMSFGTGHHQTTHLMLSNQLKVDHKDKRVMDAGCGTAILSVMASKVGAKEVDAFDIDEWSILNGKENTEVNDTPNVHIQQGSIGDLKFSESFDIVLANINKNVLIAEMEQYAWHLKPGGNLMISGFYTKDIPDLMVVAGKHGLSEVRRSEMETWACVLLQKK
ncbi:MAG TPA: 50S ribosomal protein L11 methyltransferase [Cyclobacteriaceae bacterium]|nr:50S ribosomal protein L11 methyltransferase [Cyclobacteriaceae bacterium]